MNYNLTLVLTLRKYEDIIKRMIINQGGQI